MPGRKTLGYVGVALIGVAVAAASWAGWQLLGTNYFAGKVQHQEAARLQHEYTTKPKVQLTAPAAPAFIQGQVYGLMTIPKIKLAVPIIQGTEPAQLKRGVGHFPDSHSPGNVGNVAMAGHRTTYGRPFWNIAKLQAGDRITIETSWGNWTYAVTKHWIVKPSDYKVATDRDVAPGVRALTLTSCNPRFSAQQRYVVRAELVT